jgi:tripartite-type tricarboxylate transporter receptor subunit TctC
MKILKLLAVALGIGLAAAVSPALAFPEKAVTVIVPFPAGGASDTTARVMAEKMATLLGQPVVIDNKPGATGAIGATLVKESPADGYTMLVASIGTYAVNPFLQKDLKYDPQKDFDLITVAVRTPNVLVAHPDFPAKSVAELVDYLKKNPGQVYFASSGSDAKHVPYKGGAPAIADLVGGHVNVSFQNLGAVLGHVKEGKLKALAISGSERASQLPDVPTLAEAGYQDIVVYSWQAAAAPKGLPEDVRAKLSAAAIDALKSPEVTEKFNGMGFEVVANTGDEFAKFLADELARWKSVIEAGNITAN